ANRSANAKVLEGAAIGANALREAGVTFSAIVIISASAADATQETPREPFKAVVDSGAFVDVIANRPVSSNAVPGSTGSRAETLRALADQTHGQFTTIYSVPSYPIALDRLADRLATELLLQYIVPAGTRATSDVKVGVRLPGARVNGLGVR